jgi:SAM-dependent methyltransferase
MQRTRPPEVAIGLHAGLVTDSATTRWYETHVRKYGFHYRALGFGRRSSQEKRFGSILTLGALQGKRVLDMGCGFGDLLAYLHTRNIFPQYTGVDLCAPMVEHCRKRFWDTDAVFERGDALTFDAEAGSYDYVVASGIFGLAARGTRERIEPTLRRLFLLCGTGMAVNFLSRRAPRRNPARLYLDPAEMLQLALQLTPAARLDHSYLPNDFTICMYRTPAWQQEDES